MGGCCSSNDAVQASDVKSDGREQAIADEFGQEAARVSTMLHLTLSEMQQLYKVFAEHAEGDESGGPELLMGWKEASTLLSRASLLSQHVWRFSGASLQQEITFAEFVAMSGDFCLLTRREYPLFVFEALATAPVAVGKRKAQEARTRHAPLRKLAIETSTLLLRLRNLEDAHGMYVHAEDILKSVKAQLPTVLSSVTIREFTATVTSEPTDGPTRLLCMIVKQLQDEWCEATLPDGGWKRVRTRVKLNRYRYKTLVLNSKGQSAKRGVLARSTRGDDSDFEYSYNFSSRLSIESRDDSKSVRSSRSSRVRRRTHKRPRSSRHKHEQSESRSARASSKRRDRSRGSRKRRGSVDSGVRRRAQGTLPNVPMDLSDGDSGGMTRGPKRWKGSARKSSARKSSARKSRSRKPRGSSARRAHSSRSQRTHSSARRSRKASAYEVKGPDRDAMDSSSDESHPYITRELSISRMSQKNGSSRRGHHRRTGRTSSTEVSPTRGSAVQAISPKELRTPTQVEESVSSIPDSVAAVYTPQHGTLAYKSRFTTPAVQGMAAEIVDISSDESDE